MRRDGSHPARDIDALGKLVAAAVAQAAFAAVLLIVLGVDLRGIVDMPGPMQIALGVGLGIAELGFSAFACTLALHAVLAGSGERKGDWLGPGRGGWMGQFFASARVAPRWLFTPCVFIYVAGEEVIFRAVLIEVLRPAGTVMAVGLSVMWYVGVQALHMPSARSTLFPMVGGAVVGSVHSAIYLHVPDVVPLAIAHATFFVGALVSLGGPDAAARTR
jgi:hypothetical protein